MYHIAVKCGYRVARLCGISGISQPSLASIKQHNLGLHLGQVGVPLHTCSVRSRLWQRPGSTLLSHTTTQQQHHASLSIGRLSAAAAAGLSSLTSASELSAAIAAAPTAAALQGLAAAAASTPHQAWLVQQYKVQLQHRLEDEPPVSLIKSLLFFAKMGPGHVELFERSVPVLYNQLGQLAPSDLLDLLSAYATAAQHSPSAYSQELFAALTEFLWEGLTELEPRGLADIAAGYAAVDHYDDDEDFFGGVAAAALHKLEAFCPEDLSRLLLGLSRLRFAAPDLNTASLKHMAVQMDGWTLSCVGRLLHALAAVQTPTDPCVLEKVASHISNTLRNLRTSTDGKQLLASLSQISSSSSGAAAAAGADVVGSAAAAGVLAGTLPGLVGGTGSTTRLGPSWQGFGMTRSSSNNTNTSSSSSSEVDTSSSSSSSSVVDGAASIWAAANGNSSLYEYTEHTGPPPGVTHVLEQECELGPDYITVTSYGTDGRITTTYIKKTAAGSSLGLDAIGRSPPNSSSSSSSNPGNGTAAASGGYRSSSVPIGSSNGTKAPPGTRAMASSSRGWALGGSSSSSSNGPSGSGDEGCPVSWEWRNISADCRPVYDDAAALQGALVDVLWSFAMLGHVHSTMAKECFKALALVPPEGVSDEALMMCWAAHMRYQQLGHVMLDPNPLLAESYSVFAREISRAAPRTLSLPASLQPLAAGEWLLNSIRHAPEYQQQQQQQQQQAATASLRSWKYRDPTVLTVQGLEASVRQALTQLGLPVGSPCVTLDGLERVGLPLKHNGVCIAWQVIPPAWCTRNPPHSPTVEAQAHRWALQYRGYTVLQVPFNEWASVLDSGDSLVQAGYLQQLLDSVTAVRAPHCLNF